MLYTSSIDFLAIKATVLEKYNDLKEDGWIQTSLKFMKLLNQIMGLDGKYYKVLWIFKKKY